MQPKFPYGTVDSWITKRCHFNEEFLEEAKKAENLPFYGGYMLYLPTITIKDADIIRNILVKDFHNFVDRMNPKIMQSFQNTGKKCDIIFSNQMSNTSGEEWKNIRFVKPNLAKILYI